MICTGKVHGLDKVRTLKKPVSLTLVMLSIDDSEIVVFAQLPRFIGIVEVSNEPVFSIL